MGEGAGGGVNRAKGKIPRVKVKEGLIVKTKLNVFNFILYIL